MIKDFAILKILSTVWDVTEISETVVETHKLTGVSSSEKQKTYARVYICSLFNVIAFWMKELRY